MERVQQFWLSQLAAEYSSAAASCQLAQWLCKTGGSPDLVSQCLDIAKDEIQHAVFCRSVAQAAGSPEYVNLDNRMALDLPTPYDDLRRNLLEVLIRSYCFGETIAVPLFAAMNKRSTNETVRSTYRRILDDEPRHSEFGWVCLAWLNLHWPEVNAWIAETVETALRQLAAQYYAQQEYEPPLTDEEYEWGMMPTRHYAEIFEKTTLNQCARRFEAYGVDLGPIWARVKSDFANA